MNLPLIGGIACAIVSGFVAGYVTHANLQPTITVTGDAGKVASASSAPLSTGGLTISPTPATVAPTVTPTPTPPALGTTEEVICRMDPIQYQNLLDHIGKGAQP